MDEVIFELSKADLSELEEHLLKETLVKKYVETELIIKLMNVKMEISLMEMGEVVHVS